MMIFLFNDSLSALQFTSVSGSYRAHEAGVVPGVTQSLNELITSFNWEVTAMTLSAEECNIIWEGQTAGDDVKFQFIVSEYRHTKSDQCGIRTVCVWSYLSHSMAPRPPCGRGCFQKVCHRLRRQSRWCATSAAEHASLPATHSMSSFLLLKGQVQSFSDDKSFSAYLIIRIGLSAIIIQKIAFRCASKSTLIILCKTVFPTFPKVNMLIWCFSSVH